MSSSSKRRIIITSTLYADKKAALDYTCLIGLKCLPYRRHGHLQSVPIDLSLCIEYGESSSSSDQEKVGMMGNKIGWADPTMAAADATRIAITRINGVNNANVRPPEDDNPSAFLFHSIANCSSLRGQRCTFQDPPVLRVGLLIEKVHARGDDY